MGEATRVYEGDREGAEDNCRRVDVLWSTHRPVFFGFKFGAAQSFTTLTALPGWSAGLLG